MPSCLAPRSIAVGSVRTRKRPHLATWAEEIQISAEEVSQEALAAVAQKDFARLQALFITDAELRSLGLPENEATRIRESLAQAPAKFQAVAGKLNLTDKAKWLVGEIENGRGSQKVSDRLYELETREQVVKSQLALAKGLDVVELHPPGSRELCGQGGGDPCGLRAETRPDTRPSPSCASVSPRAPNTDMQG